MSNARASSVPMQKVVCPLCSNADSKVEFRVVDGHVVSDFHAGDSLFPITDLQILFIFL